MNETIDKIIKLFQTAKAEAEKVSVGTITSSPFPTPNAWRAIINACVPFAVVVQYLLPI